MDKGQVAVLTRKYKHHSESVVTAVIKHPEESDSPDTIGLDKTKKDYVDLYLKAKKEKIIKAFTDKFPEFNVKNTIWSLTIHTPE